MPEVTPEARKQHITEVNSGRPTRVIGLYAGGSGIPQKKVVLKKQPEIKIVNMRDQMTERLMAEANTDGKRTRRKRSDKNSITLNVLRRLTGEDKVILNY